LGETHRNAIDVAVTQAMLTNPPIVHPGQSRVLLEKGLAQGYVTGVSFLRDEEEPDLGKSIRARSAVLADMIIEQFSQGITLVYLPCGSAHAKEV
jgi:hypothetical protein